MDDIKQEASVPNLRYKAFISYRHLPLDKEAAEKIQKNIEHFIVPKEFRNLSKGTKLGKVFRDEDELPISSNLSDNITYALDHTEYLIVICTPDLPKSRWCAQEIRYFLETHDRNHIIAVLADGTPEESFSPYLLHEFDEEGNPVSDLEPLAANIGGDNHTINKKSFKKEMTRIRAALLGVPFDALWQREKRSRMTQFAAAMAIVMAGLAVFLGVTLNKNAQIREQNEQIREQNNQIQKNLSEIQDKNTQIQNNLDQISDQNEQIRSQNEEISDKNLSLQKQLSSMLVDTGNTYLKNFDIRNALKNGLEAVESGDPGIYDHRAERLLMNAIGAYSINSMRGELIYEQTTNIVDMKTSQTDRKIYLADIVGNISCVDTESGKLIWRNNSVYGAQYNGEVQTRLFPVDDLGILLCKNYDNVAALSVNDGSLVWNYVYTMGNTMFALSDNGSRIAVFDRERYVPEYSSSQGPATSADINHLTDVIFLNTSDGSETGRYTLGEDQTREIPFGTGDSYGAFFSESGNTFACAFVSRGVENYQTGNYEYYLIDVASATMVRHGTTSDSLSSFDLFYGIAIDEATKSMLVCQYNNSYGGIVVTYFRGDTNTVQTTLIEQTLKGDGSFLSDYSKVEIPPMCCSKDLVVLSSEDSFFILDRASGVMKKSFAVSGNILDMIWLDEENEILRFITSKGDCHYYDLAHGDGWLDYYSKISLAQNNNAKARIAAYKENNSNRMNFDAYYTVPADNPGRLIRVRSLSDPNIRWTKLPENGKAYITFYCTSPSGERIFRLTGGKAEWFLSAFDAESGELIAENNFSNIAGMPSFDLSGIYALDEERILARCMILPLEGEVQPIGALKEYYTSFYDKNMVKSCRLYNGQVMTVVNLYSFSEIPFDYIGLDGKTVMAINEKQNRMLFSSRSVFEIGSNGFELGYGLYRYILEDGRTVVTAEKPAFMLFDALGEKRYVVEDAAPEAETRKVCLGTKEAVFACGDDTGRIWLYDIPGGSARLVSEAYSRGEIMSLTMVPGDRQLIVFSKTGKLDILDLTDGHLLYSLTFPSLLTYISDYYCECEIDEENERLYLLVRNVNENTGSLSRVDMRTWTTDFAFSDRQYYGWCKADNRIYGYSVDQYSFPAYKLEDFITWAQQLSAESEE